VGAVVLDSSVLIDLLRGRAGAARRTRRLREIGDDPLVSAVSVEEVVRGLRPREQGATRLLFDGLSVLEIGRDEAWQAGEWRRAFASRGRTLTQADCLIAASVSAAGARLATGNPRDFPMSAITVEYWPPNED
jgi:predicted nucleic acid-binding protein